MESVVVPWLSPQVIVLAEVPNWSSGTVPLPPVFDVSLQPENVTWPLIPVPFAWLHNAVPGAAAAGPANTTLTPPIRSKVAATVVIRTTYLLATISAFLVSTMKTYIPSRKTGRRHHEHRTESAEMLRLVH